MRPGKGRKKDLTKGPILKTLFVLAAPLVFGMSLHTAFNVIDTFFIGMLGSEHLAAISITFPVVFIFIAIASGLAIGSTALVSQAIGSGNRKKASNLASHSIIIGAAAGIAVAVTGFFFAPPLFSFMGVSGETLAMTIEYANLIFLGFVFMFIFFITQGLIQADGDTITPTINLSISIILNIILDPIFIFGLGPVPAMGLFGAALATVLTRTIGSVMNLIHILRGRTGLRIGGKNFKFDPAIFKRIFMVGMPSSISNSINSVGMILMMSLVGLFGTPALAAFGVGLRLESLAIMPVIGLSFAIMPFIGQNLGAGKISRAEKSMKYASYAVILFMLIFSVIWFLIPHILLSPFSSDPEVLAIGTTFFRIISLGYVFLGINFILGSSMQAAGRTGLQLIVNGGRWILTVVFAFALVGTVGINGIWMGIPLGNFVGMLMALFFIKSGIWLRKWKKPGDEPGSVGKIFKRGG